MRGIFVAGEELHVDEAEVRRNFVAGDTKRTDRQFTLNGGKQYTP